MHATEDMGQKRTTLLTIDKIIMPDADRFVWNINLIASSQGIPKHGPERERERDLSRSVECNFLQQNPGKCNKFAPNETNCCPFGLNYGGRGLFVWK